MDGWGLTDKEHAKGPWAQGRVVVDGNDVGDDILGRLQRAGLSLQRLGIDAAWTVGVLLVDTIEVSGDLFRWP